MGKTQLSGCAQDRERLRVLINLAIGIGKREGLIGKVPDSDNENPSGNHNTVPAAFPQSLSNNSSVRNLQRSKGHVKCKY